jgi:hypothetical protein
MYSFKKIAILRAIEAEVVNLVDAILKIYSGIERMTSFRWGLPRIKELLPALSSDNFLNEILWWRSLAV